MRWRFGCFSTEPPTYHFQPTFLRHRTSGNTMNTPTARPTTCPQCGSAIWHQTTPYPMRTDTTRLTNVTEELTARLWGRWTYQAFKTGTTFELIPRHTHHLDGDYTNKIVLADHTCHRIPNPHHPDYWPTNRKNQHRDLPDF